VGLAVKKYSAFAVLIDLAAALMAFVIYLIFALEHPFVGTLSVSPGPLHTSA
jgi:hypothetical protein